MSITYVSLSIIFIFVICATQHTVTFDKKIPTLVASNMPEDLCIMINVSNVFVVEDDQKRNLERELLELRSQMSRSAGATSEAEEIRRALEKSERQRVQLSDHIDVSSQQRFFSSTFCVKNILKVASKFRLQSVSIKLCITTRCYL